VFGPGSSRDRIKEVVLLVPGCWLPNNHWRVNFLVPAGIPNWQANEYSCFLGLSLLPQYQLGVKRKAGRESCLLLAWVLQRTAQQLQLSCLSLTGPFHKGAWAPTGKGPTSFSFQGPKGPGSYKDPIGKEKKKRVESLGLWIAPERSSQTPALHLSYCPYRDR
jgi:hypothetical protein